MRARASLILVIGLVFLSAPAGVAQDLSDYRTVETAIPAKTVIVSAARRQPGYLGLHVERSADGKLIVTAVEAESSAAKAGLKPTDILLEVDKTPLKQPEVLREWLLASAPGQEARLSIQRGGKTLEVTAFLGSVSRPLSTSKERAILGSSEFLLLENRGGHGYDKELPSQGLLIWRVVDGKVFLEESHGVDGPSGPRMFLGSVPFPSKANTAFTPFTTPSSRSPRGGGLPVHITNIQKLPDGRITFWIGYEFF